VNTLDDEGLEQAIQDQVRVFEGSERAFGQARERFDRDRRYLRELEGERRRRELLKVGLTEPEPEVKTRKKRSTTGMDALHGRDGVDPTAALHTFKFLSLQRREVLLNENGDRAKQTISFVDKDSGEVREAHTFGEARGLLEAGHAPGRPGVPLQRQAVWNVETEKAGWLRLDQLFVEH
jgi:hypothetical protein